MRRSFVVVAALFLAAAMTVPARGDPPAAWPVTLFSDDFEDPLPAWTKIEELVGPCHANDFIPIGNVSRTPAAARTGTMGLQVFANEIGVPLSDHLIAAHRLEAPGIVAPLRYSLNATLGAGSANTSQTGPDFGVQVTHEFPEGFRTMVWGFQYVANPFALKPWAWNLWIESDLAQGRADWFAFHHERILPGEWYRFTLDGDLVAGRYGKLVVERPNGTVEQDLSRFRIAREIRFFEEATWVSAEVENLWSNCGVSGDHIYQAKAWYDDVRLEQLGPALG